MNGLQKIENQMQTVSKQKALQQQEICYTIAALRKVKNNIFNRETFIIRMMWIYTSVMLCSMEKTY